MKSFKHSDYFYAAFISDIHLGAQNTQTAHIIDNLDAAFPDNEATAQLDTIFIAGDVFDRALLLTDPQVMEIKLWIYRFLRLCKRHKIQVRVLKGTPSHDWNQCNLFPFINDKADIGCDLVYYDKLTIDELKPHGLHVLYIPDEWRPTTEEIWEDTQSALIEAQRDTVDLSIMHGMFGFQLPEIDHLDKHQEQRYLDITELAVVCGHVHQENHYDRIYIPGSYDRLCHNDEGCKSHLRIKFYHKDGKLTTENRDIQRIPNPNPKVYHTITCDGYELEDALTLIHSRVRDFPTDSHVRLKASADHPVLKALTSLRKEHPLLNWTTKRVSDTGRPAERLVAAKREFEVVQITQDNIQSMVRDKLKTLSEDDGVIEQSVILLDRLL